MCSTNHIHLFTHTHKLLTHINITELIHMHYHNVHNVYYDDTIQPLATLITLPH